MKTLEILLLVLFGAAYSTPNKLRFDHHRVYSVTVKTEEQLRILQDLETIPNEFTFIDVPLALNSSVHMVVPPEKQADFDFLLDDLKLNSELISTNLQSAIDNEQSNRAKRAAFGWEDYHTLDEIYAWLDDLDDQYDVLSVETIGHSYEGRELKVIKLSYKEGNPGIFVETNIHAREWITSATVTWILNELLTSESTAVRELAESYDWYIIPVANPDGFVYTHTVNRLWRKTRYPYTVLCQGADPNRNFDFEWSNGGTSNNPCSDVYAGEYPESEIEVKTISNYVRSIADKLKLYLTVHSRGQYVLVPFGYTNAPYPSNYNDLMQIARRGVVDMYKVHNTPYRAGTTADVLYVASGISVDWAYGAAGIPLAYTFELRDQVQYGFILPADQIIPNAEEVLAAFVGMVDEARVLGYF
ncbi:zinc carboxypeptidase-like [Armigeres subalbatus]|uniref:zinc carboxypeptidase-like n=1 Tax=Armigeres subalbatus TaxID=124917 RepID=UPI002ED44921